MKPELRALIEQARRELRRTSGLSLSPEEQAEERRLTEIDELEKFLYNTFRPRLMFPLKAKVVWSQGGAAGQLTVDGATFHLRKEDENCYGLFVIEEQEERELIKTESSDPQFANRVLVAIGDSLAQNAETPPSG
jgi:hypothetical protein